MESLLLDLRAKRPTHCRVAAFARSVFSLVVRTFSELIRERRRTLNLTQQQLADRIGVSPPFVGHLESSKRRPSDLTVRRLAEVLGLKQDELFLSANPEAAELLRRRPAARASSAWDEFRQSYVAEVEPQEIHLLSKVASMGRVRSPNDFLYVLNSVRHVLGRELLDLVPRRSDGYSDES
jgi:transcriptional regulator with XRE-family HTH domain